LVVLFLTRSASTHEFSYRSCAGCLRLNCYPSAQGRVRRQLRFVALKNKYDPTNFFRINQEANLGLRFEEADRVADIVDLFEQNANAASTAARLAPNSSMKPSPAVLNTRPPCAVAMPSITRRSAATSATVSPSLIAIGFLLI
jgi:hypothetical protein